MKQWYTLYTKPNAEYQVAAALGGRGMRIFLPEIKSPQQGGKGDMKPFFPCYLFVKVDLSQVGPSRVRWTPGLRCVVAFGDRPAAVPDRVIDLIRCELDDLNAAGGLPAKLFRPGETVRIKGGPLQGMLAIFKGSSEPSERVRVLLTFLDHAKRVELSAADLEKVDSRVYRNVQGETTTGSLS